MVIQFNSPGFSKAKKPPLYNTKSKKGKGVEFTFPFISVRAFSASSSEAKVTNPKPFDLSETLSITILAGKKTS